GAWETNHLIAQGDGPDFQKIFALRKTYLSGERLAILAQDNKLPLEFAIWQLKNTRTGEERKLWDIFVHTAKRRKNSGNIAALSPFCALSKIKSASEMGREGASIPYAARPLFTS